MGFINLTELPHHDQNRYEYSQPERHGDLQKGVGLLTYTAFGFLNQGGEGRP